MTVVASVDGVALLRELGVRISVGTTGSGWSMHTADGTAFEAELVAPVERLTAHVIRGLSGRPQRGPQPLFVGKSATAGVVEKAMHGEIDILTESPIRLIHDGTTWEVSGHSEEEPLRQPSLRPAWMRWAVAKYLLLASGPATQMEIASVLGTSQQTVSNALKHLGAFVRHDASGCVAENRLELLNYWSEEYPGPGGEEFGWYSLDPIVAQVDRAVDLVRSLDMDPLISGDVAADALAPWKLPELGRVYVPGPVDLAGEGFIPAPVKEATLVTCIPRDPTLWRLQEVDSRHADNNKDLADIATVYWELGHARDADSREAAEHLAALIEGEVV